MKRTCAAIGAVCSVGWALCLLADRLATVLDAAISDSGSLFGPWRQTHPLLFKEDGGHGMIFEDLCGQKRLCLHAPNSERERLTLFVLHEKDGVLSLSTQ